MIFLNRFSLVTFTKLYCSLITESLYTMEMLSESTQSLLFLKEKGMSQRLPRFQQWVYYTQTGLLAVFDFSEQQSIWRTCCRHLSPFCFWPNPWHRQAVHKEIMSHLCWARVLCREKTHYSVLLSRAGLHSGVFRLWCCSAVLTGLPTWRPFRSSYTHHVVFHFHVLKYLHKSKMTIWLHLWMMLFLDILGPMSEKGGSVWP